MTETITKYLLQSIEHWRRMLAQREPTLDEAPGSIYCELCREFIGGRCNGCPVALATGQPFCEGSPYRAASEAWLRWHCEPSEASREEWRECARAELAFLEGLL